METHQTSLPYSTIFKHFVETYQRFTVDYIIHLTSRFQGNLLHDGPQKFTIYV